MWALIVTNQGVVVDAVLVPAQQLIPEELERIQAAWGVTKQVRVTTLSEPLLTYPNSPTKVVAAWVDSVRAPTYYLSVVRAASPASELQPKAWKFCPSCGCSWLSHLEAAVGLEPVDWEPKTCEECGCQEALGVTR